MWPSISLRGAWALGGREFGTGVCGAKGPSPKLIKGLGGKRGTPSSSFVFVALLSTLFAFSDCGMGARRWSEPSSQKLLENPSREHTAECTLDSVDRIELSLCGGLADTRDISLGMFNHGASYSKD